MREFWAENFPDKALLESVVSLSLLTQKSFILNDPKQALDLFDALESAGLARVEKSAEKAQFHPSTPPSELAIHLPRTWTLGELMGILTVPMAAGVLPSRVQMVGVTHMAGRTGVSHIAEGLLPMLDRRGTRSYVETRKWGTQGEALLEVRPPLAAFRPANLRVSGDIVEVRALVTCHPRLSSQAESIEKAIEQRLHDGGLLFPEAESHEEQTWDDECQVLIRVEHGNIRKLSETIALSGEMPEHTASRAMQDFQTISAHGDTLQAHWSMPLVVAALLSQGEPSVFPRLLPKWEGILSEILQSFCPAARIDTSKESISISPPLGGLSEFQGYEPFDICYPTQRANEEK